jgi:hypothetical protein
MQARNFLGRPIQRNRQRSVWRAPGDKRKFGGRPIQRNRQRSVWRALCNKRLPSLNLPLRRLRGRTAHPRHVYRLAAGTGGPAGAQGEIPGAHQRCWALYGAAPGPPPAVIDHPPLIEAGRQAAVRIPGCELTVAPGWTTCRRCGNCGSARTEECRINVRRADAGAARPRHRRSGKAPASPERGPNVVHLGYLYSRPLITSQSRLRAALSR